MARVEVLKQQLDLQPLPLENGSFTICSLSKLMVAAKDGPSPACNAIYYLLTADDPQNNLHWLFSDDTEMLLEGGPYRRYAFEPNGTVREQHIGTDVAGGQRPIFHAPGGSWKAARLDPGVDYALIGSVVAPAWNPSRVIIGAGQKFVARYADKAPWATEAFLRELIGPNWQEGI